MKFAFRSASWADFRLRPLFVERNEERVLLFLEKVAKSRRPGRLGEIPLMPRFWNGRARRKLELFFRPCGLGAGLVLGNRAL